MVELSRNSLAEKAVEHSKACFFNALFRELTASDAVMVFQAPPTISLRLDAGQRLDLPLEHYSRLGRHRYSQEAFLVKGEVRAAISFDEAVERVCDFLVSSFDAELEAIERFKKRVAGSRNVISQALSHREAAIRALYAGPVSFKDAEQGLWIGHNFHPTPKSRDPFDHDDLLKYAPEFGGAFALAWFAAHPSILRGRCAATFAHVAWTTELARHDLGACHALDDALNEGLVPLPMHPWQMKVLSEQPSLQAHQTSGNLRHLGESRLPWNATSSLRSVYQESAPFMLKFSMSVRLTNSVRHLLIPEVERGQQLYDVLATAKGRAFLAEHPTFRVVGEPGYLAIAGDDGEALRETIVVCRENPFTGPYANDTAVLATLTQDNPLGGPNLIQAMLLRSSIAAAVSCRDLARRWFDQYLELVVRPILLAQADYGIVLGAHQQNLIVEVKDGFPVGAFFRDCQGTGYTELGWSLYADEVPSLDRANGNILHESMGNWLLSYYLILNSTFNVITALAADGWATEEELLADLRRFLVNLLEAGVRDPSCLTYLLHEKAGLMHKGNFLCSFRDFNENTIPDPLRLYTRVPNDLFVEGGIE